MSLKEKDFYKTDILSDNLSPRESARLSELALSSLSKIAVKPKTSRDGYKRSKFGVDSRENVDESKSLRQTILKRDLAEFAVDKSGIIISGNMVCHYSGKEINLSNQFEVCTMIGVDHVVSLSDAWRTGGQNLSRGSRYDLATDPVELLSVSSATDNAKGDKNIDEWLPDNIGFWKQFAARQIAVKRRYKLWVTKPEAKAMKWVLSVPDSALRVVGSEDYFDTKNR